MANVGLQNFIKGFASAAAGYQRGKILSRQFQMEQEQQQFERDLRQKQIQQQFLQADRSYRLQQDQFNYLKERDTTQDANALRKETAAEKLRRDLAEQSDRNRRAEMLMKQHPYADRRVIEEEYTGVKDPNLTSPAMSFTSPKGTLPGINIGLPSFSIPGATGEEARRRLRGKTQAQIDAEKENEDRQFKRQQLEISLGVREDLAAATRRGEQEAREARERQFAENQLKKLQDEITEAKKLATDSGDPSILVQAYQEHDEFVKRYPQYGFPLKGKKSGYYFGDPRKTTGTRTSQVSVVPFPGASPQGPWSGVETGNLVTSTEGMELQEEINARNLEVAGKELKLEKAAALKSIEGMRKVFTSRAFERLPEQDQMRFFERWADEHIKAGLTPPIPKGSGYENIHPELRYRMEQMAKQKDLDRKISSARLRLQVRIQDWREKTQSAVDKAGTTGDTKDLRAALSSVNQALKDANLNLRLYKDMEKSGKPDVTAMVDIQNSISALEKQRQGLLGRLTPDLNSGSPGNQTNSAVTKDPKAKSFTVEGKTYTFTYQELLDRVKSAKRANELWHSR